MTPSHQTDAIHLIPDKTKLAVIAALFHWNLDPPSSKAKKSRIETTKLWKAPIKSSLWTDFRMNVCQYRGRASVTRYRKWDGRNVRVHAVANTLVGALESHVVGKRLEDDWEDSFKEDKPISGFRESWFNSLSIGAKGR